MRMLTSLALAAGLTLAPASFALAAEAPTPVVEEQPAFDGTTFAVRHQQLTLHQGFALATLGSMAATAGLGYWSRNGGPGGALDAHFLMAGLTTGLYWTSAILAITAPPRSGEHEGPWDTAGIHENLAWLHAAGLASTVALGLTTNFTSTNLVELHKWSAYTTLGLLALSAGVIAFGE